MAHIYDAEAIHAAGIDIPVYFNDNTQMLIGDAKKMAEHPVKELQELAKEVQELAKA